MKKKVTTYSLIIIVAILSLSLVANNSKMSNYKAQMQKFNLENQSFKEEIDKNGDVIVQQEQIILSQKDAIAQNLLDINRLKDVSSQVNVITNTIIDTIVVSHTDTIVEYFNGGAYLKLPQEYDYNSEFINVNAVVSQSGLQLNSINIQNKASITIGFKSQGFFKPKLPIVDLHNSNPYIKTQSVSNVVIEKEENFLTDKKTWGAMGIFLGLLIKN
tara:strand:- start:4115 stop:4762 length:648 start_codon:yes stop_codon:yes gene_type:complete